ncbi:guanylate kinase [Paenibacillus helianthi]|uniref:Guanylate kinase n=1 Tax=Paenibacillus helianthi TaxID=1349432 RepID=A0ABX3EP98_9BACL|nr:MULTISPECIES: guanylate kinase [Paenibacillus]OKP87109.1 guanylate kinase [Paenibacillus helianthi]OKP91297.1 guanylate kinase [Paenibacillus sp. P3E]
MWNWLKTSKASAIQEDTQNQPAETLIESSHPKIIIITGTSGSGRKSIAKQLSASLGIPYILPYTTRAARPQEEDGQHYHFISDGEFQAMVETNAFFQRVHLERGHYGIALADLEQGIEEHKAVIVVVNHEGASAFRKKYGEEALRIFIYVTKNDIQLRLEREAVPYGIVDEYLGNYTEEVAFKRESEYLLQNMEPELTVQKIKEFLQTKI